MAADDAAVTSVIVKQIKEEAACGFSDWASLEFLSHLPAARSIVPGFYGGDVGSRLFVMEDLRDSISLDGLLKGYDKAAAGAALQSMAVQTARLHAATVGTPELFAAIRAALPEAAALGRHSETQRWLDGREKILNWFRALDCSPPDGFDDCLGAIAGAYREPAEFLAFTHGDPAPSNVHFARGHAWLLDFEYGGYRHALYDMTAWQVLCPLPEATVTLLKASYRSELAKTCVAAQDETRFAEAWACLCAYRALAILTWIPPDVLGENRPWADDWTVRQAVLAAVHRLEQVAAPIEALGPVYVAAAALNRALRSRWPEYEREEDLFPRWRALQTG